MVTIKQIEAGAMLYVEKELLPALVSMADKALHDLCSSRAAQMMGIASPDGTINVDVVRTMAQAMIPESGLAVNLPGKMSITFHRSDLDKLCQMIKEG